MLPQYILSLVADPTGNSETAIDNPEWAVFQGVLIS